MISPTTVPMSLTAALRPWVTAAPSVLTGLRGIVVATDPSFRGTDSATAGAASPRGVPG